MGWGEKKLPSFTNFKLWFQEALLGLTDTLFLGKNEWDMGYLNQIKWDIGLKRFNLLPPPPPPPPPPNRVSTNILNTCKYSFKVGFHQRISIIIIKMHRCRMVLLGSRLILMDFPIKRANYQHLTTAYAQVKTSFNLYQIRVNYYILNHCFSHLKKHF